MIAGVALFASSSRAGPAESGLTKARLGFSEASESLSPDSDSESGSYSESDAGSPCRVCIRGACLPTAGGCGIMRTRWSLRSSKLRSGQNCQCGWVGELVGAVRARARVSASASACGRACASEAWVTRELPGCIFLQVGLLSSSLCNQELLGSAR